MSRVMEYRGMQRRVGGGGGGEVDGLKKSGGGCILYRVYENVDELKGERR